MQYNKIELMVIDMVRQGKPIHGMARDIMIDMILDGRFPKQENKGE